MQRIIRSFEFATTNIIGSHVAYAAYCGCRVAFYGENQELKIDDVLSHPYYRANPKLGEHVHDRMFNNAKLKVYPGYPHGMLTIHADVLNPDILEFIRS